MKNILVYLKTTETCNLNCKHCFTNGTNGAKIYWNTDLVIDWITRLKSYAPNLDNIHFEFHGGEPFLVPVSEMKEVYDACDGLWDNMSWCATTNLTYKLDSEIVNFVKNQLGNRVGTSWDPKIRFANTKQSDLWLKNVKTLLSEGITVKLFISVTKDTINIDPIHLLSWIKILGVQEVSFERLTGNGNANLHPEIFPSNLEQDAWFLKMHEQTVQYDARKWFSNDFLEDVYDKFESGFNKSGTFCRNCEEKLFTINADGTIAGCPNSAPENYFGKITDSIEQLLTNPARIENIACERSGDTRCYSCEVFEYCGGDCHQLSWQDDVCGAPKSLMKSLAGINIISNKIINIRKEKWPH